MFQIMYNGNKAITSGYYSEIQDIVYTQGRMVSIGLYEWNDFIINLGDRRVTVCGLDINGGKINGCLIDYDVFEEFMNLAIAIRASTQAQN